MRMSITSRSPSAPPIDRPARDPRPEALGRLQRARLQRALRLAKRSTSNFSMAKTAVETIELIEQRIQYWNALGDIEHVERLEHIRRQLITTYLR